MGFGRVDGGVIWPPATSHYMDIDKIHPLKGGLVITPLAAARKGSPPVTSTYHWIARNEPVLMDQVGPGLDAFGGWGSALPLPQKIPGHSFSPRPNGGPLVAIDCPGFVEHIYTRRPGLGRPPSWRRPRNGKRPFLLCRALYRSRTTMVL